MSILKIHIMTCDKHNKVTGFNLLLVKILHQIRDKHEVINYLNFQTFDYI
jgi:hypothetical protein